MDGAVHPGSSGRSGGRDPRQISVARLAEFGHVPRRSLGQNFLVDDNVIRVILARLGCEKDDVVIEVGAGMGVLTKALVAVAGHVHAFEIDDKLLDPLRASLEGPQGMPANLTLHMEDVLNADMGTLEPPPTLCASNLPYSIAAPFLAEAVCHLPSVRRYVVMSQREVAERLVARSGGKTYGSISVWMRLHTRVVETRPLSRTIFRPIPRVDSTLLTLDRRVEDELVEREPQLVRSVIDMAFSSRRKTWVNAVAAATGLPKEAVAAAGAEAGLAPCLRAEQLEPQQYLALSRAFLDRGWQSAAARSTAYRPSPKRAR
ncbi:MAG: ribosomal RNA small subunit methyltransferase A [Actinobacteria bacterium]|nr:ribosomal RNA small subunit methyltransferase A [Actinomycetota bacterium]